MRAVLPPFPSFARALALLTAFVTPARAHAQPIVTVSRPLVSTPAEFTDVSTVRLFGDGTMLVADPGAREFVRVTRAGASGATLTVIGRQGSGPAEYQSAQMLLAMPRGESVLVDPPQNRWLVYDSTGTYRRTQVFLPAASMLRNGEMSDETGHVYALSMPVLPPAQPTRRILRWSPGNGGEGRVDSLATVQGAEMVAFPLPKGADGRSPGTAFLFVPESPQDVWTALPNGGLAIYRPALHAIEWIDARGGTIGSTPLPVLPRVPVSDSVRNAEKRTQVRERIPATRAFTPDARLFAWPDGSVWLRRTTGPDEPFSELLEITRTRGVVRRLRFPPASRPVGQMTGRSGRQVVMARRVDGDLQQLDVFLVPPASK